MQLNKQFLLVVVHLIIFNALAAKNPLPLTKKLQTEEGQTADIYKWLKTASEVTAIVQERSFRKVDFSQFFQDSLRAGMASVDAHSAFIKNYEDVVESTSGKFTGIGVSIISKSSEDDALVITDVQEGGPAYKAGLMSGDKIVEIDGSKLKGLSSDEAISKIKGKTGTKVNVKIIRKRKPLSFTVSRQLIKDQNQLCYYFKNQQIYYFSLKMFTETAAKQMSELLTKANNKECRGIILDLRNNPGGLLESAVDMAALFVDKGSEVVSSKTNDNKVVARHCTNTDPVLKSDLPIFILINNFTASASEILAGCLRHYSQKQSDAASSKKLKRKLMVFLVGTTTFGKGSVQEVMPISNGCALKLTTMLYYLPDDISIQSVGIAPDFAIMPKKTMLKEQKWVEELYGKESSLKNSIGTEEVEALARGGKTAPAGIKKTAKKAPAEEAKSSSDEEDDDNNDDDQLTSKTQDERIQEEITKNVQVQACVNMITLLDMAKRCSPALVTTRPKALDFLKQNYVSDDPIALEKVK